MAPGEILRLLLFAILLLAFQPPVPLRPITAGANSGTALTLASYYDPQVEFLELGVGRNGNRTWKVYGPDATGRYGGRQGIGGLEALVEETSGSYTGIVNNYFGDVVAIVNAGAVGWNPAPLGGYGTLPHGTAQALDAEEEKEEKRGREKRGQSTILDKNAS